MEYVPGGTLRGIIKSFGPFPDKVTKFLTAQILDGLAYLHSNYIVHRVSDVYIFRQGARPSVF